MEYMVGNAARKMIESVYSDTDEGPMVCNVCSEGTGDQPFCALNSPRQFIDHCIGKKHYKAVKRLKFK